MVTISIYCNNAAGGKTGEAERVDFDGRSFTGKRLIFWQKTSGKDREGKYRPGLQIGELRRIFPVQSYINGSGRTDTVTVEDTVHGEIMDALQAAGWKEVVFAEGEKQA